MQRQSGRPTASSSGHSFAAPLFDPRAERRRLHKPVRPITIRLRIQDNERVIAQPPLLAVISLGRADPGTDNASLDPTDPYSLYDSTIPQASRHLQYSFSVTRSKPCWNINTTALITVLLLSLGPSGNCRGLYIPSLSIRSRLQPSGFSPMSSANVWNERHLATHRYHAYHSCSKTCATASRSAPSFPTKSSIVFY